MGSLDAIDAGVAGAVEPELSEAADSPPALQSETLSLSVMRMNGDVVQITGVDSAETLEHLIARVISVMALPQNRQVSLCLGARRFSPHEQAVACCAGHREWH